MAELSLSSLISSLCVWFDFVDEVRYGDHDLTWFVGEPDSGSGNAGRFCDLLLVSASLINGTEDVRGWLTWLSSTRPKGVSRHGSMVRTTLHLTIRHSGPRPAYHLFGEQDELRKWQSMSPKRCSISTKAAWDTKRQHHRFQSGLSNTCAYGCLRKQLRTCRTLLCLLHLQQHYTTWLHKHGMYPPRFPEGRWVRAVRATDWGGRNACSWLLLGACPTGNGAILAGAHRAVLKPVCISVLVFSGLGSPSGMQSSNSEKAPSMAMSNIHLAKRITL
ncbi:hypothetical protein M011DRAFT_20541 [Sporormia fimetaria CBS 119925]|uniref:Uncharacterized protein n=1 Tax=Sporormia fimetaria CBS 119925 TaxID=1340428 RepID=A0A6A6VSR1_9PLEO|nr:hypothetical protein M011DRAFT_20541 [Sporormia fimetaria CBS 119925]